MLYAHGIHLVPSLHKLSRYLKVMKQKPGLFSRIQEFVIVLSGSDLPAHYDPKRLNGLFASDAATKGATFLRPQDKILRAPELLDGDPQSQHEHDILLKDLLTAWETKKDLLFEHVGPERIILYLGDATCRAGCHRLHRGAIFSWMSQGRIFPAELRVMGLPPEESLSDLVTGMGGTIGPTPPWVDPFPQEMMDELLRTFDSFGEQGRQRLGFRMSERGFRP